MNSSSAPESVEPPPSQTAPFDLGRRLDFRSSLNLFMDGLVALLTLGALIPLISLLYMVLKRGMKAFSFDMLWSLPPAAGMEGGGFGNAILGTAIMVGIASLVAVPIGVLTAVYTTELAAGTKSAGTIRFIAKILAGLPSILAGVFIFAVVVLTFKKFSVVAGGLSLAILMLPIVILTAEEALLRVPKTLKEGALALGATRAQGTLTVVLPAASPAILTGVMLAVARAAGETAPLIFTALFSYYWFDGFQAPTASLSVLIYNFSGVPYDNMIDIAWSASMVLILIVLVVNVVSQLVAHRR